MSQFHQAEEPGPIVRCWNCDSLNDGHSSIGDRPAQPKDGDVSICAYCAAPGIYEVTDMGLRMRSMNHDEWAEVMANPNFRRAYDAVRALVAEKN